MQFRHLKHFIIYRHLPEIQILYFLEKPSGWVRAPNQEHQKQIDQRAEFPLMLGGGRVPDVRGVRLRKVIWAYYYFNFKIQPSQKG